MEPDDDSGMMPAAPNKVEITVAAHTVVIESAEPLDDILGYALGLFQQTAASAARIPVGFDTTGIIAERGDPAPEPGTLEEGGHDDRVRRLERELAQIRTARRLVLQDPPSNHRPRLGPLPLDREQRPLS